MCSIDLAQPQASLRRSPAALPWRQSAAGERSLLVVVVHLMFQPAHLIVARPNRLVGGFDGLAAFTGQLVALQRRLEFFLEIILSRLDGIDDPLIVAAGHRRLEVEPRLVGRAHERAVVGRIAA